MDGKNDVFFALLKLSNSLLPGGDIGESVVAFMIEVRLDVSISRVAASASEPSTIRRRSSDRHSRTQFNTA